MKKWCAIIAVVLCVACLLFLMNGNNDASAVTAEELIRGTLQELGVSDAVLAPAEEDAVIYSSAAEGLNYYFDSETGVLARIMNNGLGSVELDDQSETMEPENLRAVALECAEDCIASQLIGELYVTVETVSGDTTTYEIVEKYDGIPTGTKLGMIYRNDGELFGCVPHYGSVFVKKADGRVELVKGDNFIGENEAIARATEALDTELGIELADSAVITVQMDALGGELSYCVMFENANPELPTRIYSIKIDAYTGEVLETAHTV